MRNAVIIAVLTWVLLLGVGNAAEQLQFASPASWVKENQIPRPDPEKQDAPYQFLLLDTQINFADPVSESYVRTAIKVQSPEGLGAAGNVAISWHPDTSEVIVHHLRILRGDQVIDVLEQGQRFTILRREPNLEAATLDGVLTAAMQPSGIQIGDIVDIAYTQTLDNPVFGGTASHTTPFITSYEVRELNIRYQWPESRNTRWQTSSDLPAVKISKIKNGRELRLTLKDIVAPTEFPESAPAREYLTGLLEISDIQDWGTISSLMAPLFNSASKLDSDSLLKAEAMKIASETSDPIKRTEMALRLVQDQVRYLFLGMDAGAYVPASADDTWARRFGDCKAKTALLLALLRELGIDAEPALVSSSFGDGLPERLPSFALFDHVIVKASIGDSTYWLDGTRIGDRQLKYIALSGFHWALPIRETGASLERIDIKPLNEPVTAVFLDIDASDGFPDKTPAVGRMIITGDAAILLKQQLTVLPQNQKNESLKAIWQTIDSGIKPDQSDIMFDDDAPIATATFSGLIELQTSSPTHLKHVGIPGSRIGWDVAYMEDGLEERTAPWLITYPLYRKDHITITLPKANPHIMLDGKDIDTTIGGVELFRDVTVEDGKATMTASTRTTQEELPASESADFVTKMKAVYNNKASIGLPDTSELRTKEELDHWKLEELSTADDYNRRATAFLHASRLEEAISDFTAAIALNDTNSAAYSDRGLALILLGRSQDAASDLERALKLNPNNWVAVYGEGLSFMENENYTDAIQKFDKALKLNSDYLFALNSRAYAKAELDDLEGAISDLTFYYERLPQDTAQLPQLAFWLKEAERYDKALSVINQAITTEPTSHHLVQLRADIFEEMGNLEEALRNHDKAVEMASANATTLNNRCWFRAMNNFELEQALKDCARAIEKDPEYAPAFDSRGYVHLRLGDPEKAITDFNAALAIEDDLSASFYGRGLAKLRKGDASGEEDVALALEMEPTLSAYFEEYGLTQ